MINPGTPMNAGTPRDPKPGSEAAAKQGCTCPVLDNGHGLGRWGEGDKYGWYTAGDCPLHSTTAPKPERVLGLVEAVKLLLVVWLDAENSRDGVPGLDDLVEPTWDLRRALEAHGIPPGAVSCPHRWYNHKHAREHHCVVKGEHTEHQWTDGWDDEFGGVDKPGDPGA